MKRAALGFVLVSWGATALAQDLVVTNARILDVDTDIARGSIVIEDGRIVSVAAGAAAVGGKPTLDAGGRTVLPGYIDAHRHIINGDTEQWFREQSVARMQEFLDAGFTTLMSGGGPMPGIMELKRRIDSGELKGPRVITSGRADPANFKTPEEARAAVRALAAAHVEIVKAAVTPAEKDMLAVVVDEARKHDLDVMVHAVTVPAMIAAIDAGAAKLVHTPHDSFLTNEQAKLVADHGMASRICRRSVSPCPCSACSTRTTCRRFATVARGRRAFSPRARTPRARKWSTRARSGTTASSTVSAPTRTTCPATACITSSKC
jgi:imidazolonepropionase-like amidohydrolase